MSGQIKFSTDLVKDLSERLNQHPLYSSLRETADLKIFMQHHVYAVWDFMSLLKYLQHQIAPASYPWKPAQNSTMRFFINQIVMAEESDETLPDDQGRIQHKSHFELYCDAMKEIGANPEAVLDFAANAADSGMHYALRLNVVPEASRAFMSSTFGL